MCSIFLKYNFGRNCVEHVNWLWIIAWNLFANHHFCVKMAFLGFFACMMVLWLFEIPLWVARFLAISWASPSLLMGFVVV